MNDRTSLPNGAAIVPWPDGKTRIRVIEYDVLDVAVGVAGNAFTTTVVVPTKLVHPEAFVIVTLYVPAIANVEEGRVGF